MDLDIRCYDCSEPVGGEDSVIGPSLPSEDHEGGVVVCRRCGSERQAEFDRQTEQALGAW